MFPPQLLNGVSTTSGVLDVTNDRQGNVSSIDFGLLFKYCLFFFCGTTVITPDTYHKTRKFGLLSSLGTLIKELLTTEVLYLKIIKRECLTVLLRTGALLEDPLGFVSNSLRIIVRTTSRLKTGYKDPVRTLTN